MKPTLVTGANGHLGGTLCRLLRARGEPVRAMMRPSADGAAAEALGATVVRGDILDAASTARAMAGCGRVYHTAAGFLMWSKHPERDIVQPSVDGTRHVVEAAAAAGVEKVLYVSTGGATPPRPNGRSASAISTSIRTRPISSASSPPSGPRS
jgi:dihydroflavonol-4-reductase